MLRLSQPVTTFAAMAVGPKVYALTAAGLLAAVAVGAGGVLIVQSAGDDATLTRSAAPSQDASLSPSASASPSAAVPTATASGPSSPPAPPSPQVPELTAAALSSAPVPSLCGHAAGNLVSGHLPNTPPGEGGVELSDTSIGDLDGDGVAEAAALISCSQGNSVLASVHLYRRGLRPIGEVDHEEGLGSPFAATSVRISGGLLQVTGYSYAPDDPSCCPSGMLVRRFGLSGSTITSAPAPGLDERAVLTGDGWGNVQVGDPYMELARATGLRIALDDLEDLPVEEASCVYVGVDGRDDVTIMGGEGKVRSVVFSAPGVKSRSGVGVGDTEADVLRIYAGRTERIPNTYVSVPDVIVRAGDGRIVRFEFTEDHVVSTMHAGEVNYAGLIEGCA